MKPIPPNRRIQHPSRRPRPARRPAAYTAGVCLVLSLASGGCTSIRWTDRHGVTHHRGLVAAVTSVGERGSSIQRMALGLDLRLSGEGRGFSLGFDRTRLRAPRILRPRHPADFPTQLAAQLRGDEQPATRTERWHWFWFDEPITSRAADVDAQCVGFGVAETPARRVALNLGYHARHGPFGPALAEHRALVEIRREDDWELTLWTIDTNSDSIRSDSSPYEEGGK